MDKRHKIFFIVAASALLLIVARMLSLAGPLGRSYRQEVVKMARHTGSMPAIRGRIFDHDGNLLVWSERCYDLILLAGKYDPAQQKNMLQELQCHFPGITLPDHRLRNDLVLKSNLTAAEVEKADQLCNGFPALDVELRWERRINDRHSEVGQVRQINGIEQGISGWEKEYDELLRGTSGKFTVMLDRHGRWVNSTFKLIEAAVDGQDVILPPHEEIPHE